MTPFICPKLSEAIDSATTIPVRPPPPMMAMGWSMVPMALFLLFFGSAADADLIIVEEKRRDAIVPLEMEEILCRREISVAVES